jgi:hypothetical protein
MPIIFVEVDAATLAAPKNGLRRVMAAETRVTSNELVRLEQEHV